MTKAIDPAKLKAAAEHLEWVLSRYPDSDDVQGLYHALLPLIEQARAGQVHGPLERQDVPCGYNFADGVYRPYTDPNVDEAYVRFSIEMRGGLTEQDKKRLARMDAMRNSKNKSQP
jgi:hypothetical protein